MSASTDETAILDNPAPPETAWRTVAKRLFWRLLPRSVYQRLLAYSKSRDFRTGRFREPELDLVDSLVRPSESAVDVGANHGMWTLALSGRAGVGGRVFAFEPVPFTFGTLSAVVRRNRLGNVTLVNKGCSDQTGRVEFTVPMQRSGSSDDLQAHLATRQPVGSSENGNGTRISCEMTTLDTALDGVEDISLLKLDIEGAELLALRGAAKLLERERPAIVCEVDAGFLEGFEQEPADLVEFLARWDYEPHRYDAERRHLLPVSSPAQIEHANLVFLTEAHRDRVERFQA
jgi:FkbM family methyltransferase